MPVPVPAHCHLAGKRRLGNKGRNRGGWMTTEPEQPVPPALEPVELGYKNVLRVRFLIFWLVIWAAAAVFDRAALQATEFAGFPTIAVFVVAAAGGLTAPPRLYARLRYPPTQKPLQVVPGRLVPRDTVLP